MQKMSLSIKVFSVFAILILAISFLPVKSAQAAASPISLNNFAAALNNSNASQLVGIYIDNILALRVVQQPSPYFVSSLTNTVTQFGLAANHGSIGLLAHNYLSGMHFPTIAIGTKINLIFGDGSIKTYLVEKMKKYLALSPDDLHSDFENLDNPSGIISGDQVIKETYGTGELVLQTCLENNGNLTWGRLFIIASLVE
jgi:hypothetical protein